MAKLAHVAGVANRSEPEVVRRLVAEIRGIVDAREAYFRAHGIDSIETYRRRRAEGRVDDGYGDVFLVVDGWPTVRAEFDELEGQITELAGRGLTFGVHVVLTTSRWMDFRNQIRDVLGTRVELRLGDPTDSEVDRRVAANVPKGRPGRGLTMTKHHFLGGIPRIDDRGSVDDLGDGVEDLVTRVNAAWQGPRGPKLRLLPEEITLDAVRELAGPDDRRLLLGVDEANLAPIGLDLAEEPHLYLLGDGDSGKTAFLRTVAHEVARLHTPDEAKLFVVDYRRGLLGELPEAHVGEYLTTEEQTVGAVEGITEFLRTRLPGPDVTPEQLRARSWWSGAEVYFLVDDYDLVVTSSGSPLRPLVPLLAQAGDVGSTSSSPGAAVGRRGRCSSRCSRASATSAAPASCSRAARTRGCSSAASRRRRSRPAARASSRGTSATRCSRPRGSLLVTADLGCPHGARVPPRHPRGQDPVLPPGHPLHHHR